MCAGGCVCVCVSLTKTRNTICMPHTILPYTVRHITMTELPEISTQCVNIWVNKIKACPQIDWMHDVWMSARFVLHMDICMWTAWARHRFLLIFRAFACSRNYRMAFIDRLSNHSQQLTSDNSSSIPHWCVLSFAQRWRLTRKQRTKNQLHGEYIYVLVVWNNCLKTFWLHWKLKWRNRRNWACIWAHPEYDE